MPIRFILKTSCIKLLSSDCDVSKKKRNVQNQLFYFVVDDMITKEKIQKLLFYFWRIICISFQNSC